MKAAFFIVFAFLIAIAYQQCVGVDITDPLQGIDKAFHTLQFLPGGIVKYNLTQNTLYNNQQINVTVISQTNSPITEEDDVCDYNNVGKTYWSDSVSAAPQCDRSVVAQIPFQQFVTCNNLLKDGISIGGVAYDRYRGVVAAVLYQKNGQVAGVDNYLTTRIYKIFTIRLQKEITLIANLTVTQPEGVFEAGAVLQRYNYDVARLEVFFFVVSSVNGYSLSIAGGSGTGSRNHPFTYSTTTSFNCPAGHNPSQCQRYLLRVSPQSDCSWDLETYNTQFTIQCNGCLVQSNTVTVSVKSSLADICDVVSETFDVIGQLRLFTDNTYSTPLVGPVSLSRTVYLQADLSATFAPIVKVDLDDFYLCSALNPTCILNHANTKALKQNGVIQNDGQPANFNLNPVNPAIISSGLNVQIRWAYDLKFETGAIDQSYLALAGGQIQHQANLNVFYVNKKNAVSLKFDSKADDIPEEGGNVAYAINDTPFKIVVEENASVSLKASIIVALCIISTLFYFF